MNRYARRCLLTGLAVAAYVLLMIYGGIWLATILSI